MDKSVEKQKNPRSDSNKRVENNTVKNSKERPSDNYLTKIEKESKNVVDLNTTTNAQSQNQIQGSASSNNAAMLKPIPIQMFQM